MRRILVRVDLAILIKDGSHLIAGVDIYGFSDIDNMRVMKKYNDTKDKITTVSQDNKKFKVSEVIFVPTSDHRYGRNSIIMKFEKGDYPNFYQ